MLDKMILPSSNNAFFHKLKWLRLFAAMSLLLLSACASNVVVKSNIPSPLVEKLPLDGTLNYSEKFKNYTYFENAKERRSLKSLDMSAAQISLFDTIFAGLVNLVEPTNTKPDIIIAPEVLDFQYTAPVETKLKHYEVWIKYRLKISNGLNQKIADWVVKGYGKTPNGLLTSSGSAFNSAANVALRDVGAQLSIQFAKQKVIQAIIDGEMPEVIIEDNDTVESSDNVASEKTQVVEPKAASEKNQSQEELAAKELSKKSKWEVSNDD